MYSAEGREGIMENKGDIKEALRGLLPMKIGEEYKEKIKGAIPIRGKVTAAQALAASLISKAIEGDPKAFSLIFQLTGEEKPMEQEGFNIDIKVVE